MGIFAAIGRLYREYRSTKDFKRCPCDACGGMVSIEERMIPGQHGWYCSEESRERYESAYKEYLNYKKAS